MPPTVDESVRARMSSTIGAWAVDGVVKKSACIRSRTTTYSEILRYDVASSVVPVSVRRHVQALKPWEHLHTPVSPSHLPSVNINSYCT